MSTFLIICSYYPPDSSIAAVRPYMFAKYLTRMGHKVVVLRSGDFNSIPFNDYPDIEGVDVFSYRGENSDAECYKKGEFHHTITKKKPKGWFLPKKIRSLILCIYHITRSPLDVMTKLRNARRNFRLQKKCLDAIKDKGYIFDVIFSTYSNLENIYAGEYASLIFDCSWVQDFRDPVTTYNRRWSFLWNIVAEKIQKKTVNRANLCTTVSLGVANQLSSNNTNRVKVVNNGYEVSNRTANKEIGKLTFCYTGQIYEADYPVIDEFARCLSELISDKCVLRDKIIVNYAGNDATILGSIFKIYGIEDLIHNYGLVSRNRVEEIQFNSDIFIVMVWNTKKTSGVISGKFYEGIRAKMPILALVAGNVDKSELCSLQKKYNYGFCYEYCKKKSDFVKLKGYIEKLYIEKMTKNRIDYSPSKELFTDFTYENLTKRLIDCLNEIV